MAHAAGSAAERVLLSTGAIDRGRARARGRRALRPRPPRPAGLPRRPRRGQARHARRDQALPGRARLLRRRPHAARRDGRPGQRARRRRHRGHDRLRGAPRGRLAGRHRARARAASTTRTGGAATAPRPSSRPIDEADAGARPRAAGRPALRPHAGSRSNFGASRRGRVGHPARAAGDLGGRRPRRLRHPLRAAARRRCGSATASTACSRRRRSCPPRSIPAVISRIKILSDLDIAERRIPQDGRVSTQARGQGDRPPRRDAARAVRREGRHAHPGLVARR